MKRKIAAVFAAAIIAAAALTACSSSDTDSQASTPADSTVSGSSGTSDTASTSGTSLNEQIQSITDSLSSSYDATGVDVETLDKFFSTLASSRYRISGTVSNYTVNEYTEGYKIATATITNGDTKYMISLDSTDETLTDGEYVEVEGSLGTTISADTTNGYGAFTLSDCTIIDRSDEQEAD